MRKSKNISMLEVILNFQCNHDDSTVKDKLHLPNEFLIIHKYTFKHLDHPH